MARRDIALKYFDEQKETVGARIDADIEKNRQADACIRFVCDGELPRDITVEVKQVGHEFRFGSNIFMLDEFECEEKNAWYREKFPEINNLATLPFYWNANEPERETYRFSKDSPKLYRRPNIELCMEYCREKGIEPKAHCLNYDYMRPNWIRGASPEEHRAALEKRFRELAELYGDKIKTWEVTNETFNTTFARAFLDPHYSEFYRERDFNEWSYRTADKYFPNNHLMINDHLDFGCMRSLHGEYFGARSPYYMEIDRLLERGCHLDAIGFQFHCFFDKSREAELNVTRYNPTHLLDVLDTYACLGRKIQMTELTISALGGTEEDEEVQAELVENLYKLFFSHKAMEAIIYWNVVDGYAVGAVPGDMTRGENRYYGGLCRFDMTEKPAYKILNRLINHDWHTETVVKAVNGEARFRGFAGDYQMRVFADGREIPVDFTLASEGDNTITVKM